MTNAECGIKGFLLIIVALLTAAWQSALRGWQPCLETKIFMKTCIEAGCQARSDAYAKKEQVHS
jgi:hypothetical protein